MTMKLPTDFAPIMPNITTEHPNMPIVMRFGTPTLLARKPGLRRPRKLNTFKMTNCNRNDKERKKKGNEDDQSHFMIYIRRKEYSRRRS